MTRHPIYIRKPGARLGGPAMGPVREAWDVGDPFGSALNAAFAVALTLYRADEPIPAEWEFRPGAGADSEPEPGLDDWLEVELHAEVQIGAVTADDLRRTGTVLLRLVDAYRAAGLGY